MQFGYLGYVCYVHHGCFFNTRLYDIYRSVPNMFEKTMAIGVFWPTVHRCGVYHHRCQNLFLFCFLQNFVAPTVLSQRASSNIYMEKNLTSKKKHHGFAWKTSLVGRLKYLLDISFCHVNHFLHHPLPSPWFRHGNAFWWLGSLRSRRRNHFFGGCGGLYVFFRRYKAKPKLCRWV